MNNRRTAVLSLITCVLVACNQRPTDNTIQPPSIAYSIGEMNAIRSAAITPISAISSGGPTSDFIIAPDLPSGISLNPTTGAISGTPTIAYPQTTHTITANGPGGVGTTSITISVIDSIGLSWTNRTPGAISGLTNVSWTRNQFIAVGNTHKSIQSLILTSPDGLNWTERFSGTAAKLSAATSSEERYVIVGNGVILLSDDGVNWTVGTAEEWEGLNSVTWTGTQFVAVGNDGAIVTSPDGLIWTSRNLPNTEHLVSVIWTGTQLVSAGYSRPLTGVTSGLIYTSQDGITWIRRLDSGFSEMLSSVVWTGNYFVTVGRYTSGSPNNSAMIKTSPDGVSWTSRESNASSLRSVVWTGSQLVALAYIGEIALSANGITWTTTNPPLPPNNPQMNAIAWSGSALVAVGASFLGAGDGVIISSP